MKTSTIKRGEIWLVEFDPTRGAEIQKTRPAVVVDKDSIGVLPLRIVAPITDWKPLYAKAPWFTHLLPDQTNGLTKESGVDGFQVKSLSEERFVRRLGSVTNEQIEAIVNAIVVCIYYPPTKSEKA